MKYSAALLVVSFACALGTPVDNSEPIEPNFDAYTSVRLLLSTRSNLGSPIQLRFRDLPSINGSPFNPERPTRILIHGWTEDAESDIKVETSRELLELYDFNVIFVDWSEGANLITYVGARNRVPLVATFLASYIDFLVQSNLLDLNRLTIVGFSLGAHMAGIAGKQITSGRVNTIIGLDPAGPLFSVNTPEERLNEGDAVYVEAIHTNGGFGQFGIGAVIANADFFPNGGQIQPGCFTSACHHTRAVSLYIESVRENRFFGLRCATANDALLNRCTSEPGAWFGGEPSNAAQNTWGIFRFTTSNNAPFGNGPLQP